MIKSKEIKITFHLYLDNLKHTLVFLKSGKSCHLMFSKAFRKAQNTLHVHTHVNRHVISELPSPNDSIRYVYLTAICPHSENVKFLLLLSEI